MKRAPYKIIKGDNEQPVIVSRGNEYTIPEVSAFVLRHIKALAEAYIGQPVTKAVITVPANFNDAQREATKRRRARSPARTCCASSTSPPPPRWPTASATP